MSTANENVSRGFQSTGGPAQKVLPLSEQFRIVTNDHSEQHHVTSPKNFKPDTTKPTVKY